MPSGRTDVAAFDIDRFIVLRDDFVIPLRIGLAERWRKWRRIEKNREKQRKIEKVLLSCRDPPGPFHLEVQLGDGNAQPLKFALWTKTRHTDAHKKLSCTGRRFLKDDCGCQEIHHGCNLVGRARSGRALDLRDPLCLSQNSRNAAQPFGEWAIRRRSMRVSMPSRIVMLHMPGLFGTTKNPSPRAPRISSRVRFRCSPCLLLIRRIPLHLLAATTILLLPVIKRAHVEHLADVTNDKAALFTPVARDIFGVPRHVEFVL